MQPMLLILTTKHMCRHGVFACTQILWAYVFATQLFVGPNCILRAKNQNWHNSEWTKVICKADPQISPAQVLALFTQDLFAEVNLWGES